MLTKRRQHTSKNLTKILILFVLIISNFSTLITFAQTNTNQCSSCGTTPQQFDNYENFVKDILSNIQTTATKGEYTGKPVSPSWFQGNVFEIPEQQHFTLNKLVSGIKDRFKKTANIFGATAAILFSIGRELITKDGVGGFLILFKQRTFVEARRRLLDLDALIHDKMFELGLAGGFFEDLTPTNRKYIQQTINKYVQTEDNPDALLTSAQLYEGIKYYQLTEMLLRTNSAMKTFIGGNRIKQFEDKEFHKGWETKFSLSFNFEQIKLMKEGYQCARGLEGLKNCNKAFKKFRASIKQISGKNIEGAKKSVKTITDANKKFKQAFSVAAKQFAGKDLNEDDQKFLDEEKKLLRTLYGLDADKMTNNMFFAKTNKFRSTITKGDLSLKSEREQSSTRQKIQNAKEKIREKNETLKDYLRDKEKNKFEKERSKALQECLVNYNKDERKKLIRTINIYIAKKDESLKTQITTCSEIHSLVSLINKQQLTDKSIINVDKDEIQEAIDQGDPDIKINGEITNIYIKSMDTLIDHQQEYLKQMTLADNKDLTLFFSEIFEQTHITKEIIGTKDEGLINNLGASCELQCKNKGGQCYY